jgi:hypothetical protein
LIHDVDEELEAGLDVTRSALLRCVVRSADRQHVHVLNREQLVEGFAVSRIDLDATQQRIPRGGDEREPIGEVDPSLRMDLGTRAQIIQIRLPRPFDDRLAVRSPCLDMLW